MKSWKCRTILWVLLAIGIFSIAHGYTSSDYYNAGLQLYKAKNYQQAIQYFGAAITVDPNNTAALQGRANCYYMLGQYSQALADYQKVQSLQPSPQLASLIQSLQAKVGAGPSAPPPPATSGASFGQGVALFQQRQYAQAIPYFQKATQENPNDANAYYYLGICQTQAGDLKDAAAALGISNKLNPNPSVAAYVNQLKARLSPDDQQWVDSQVGGGSTAAASAAVAAKPKRFGFRLEPSLLVLNLADFNGNAQYWYSEAQTLQSSFDPSFGDSGAVPSGALNIGIEPVLRIIPQLEIGLSFAALPVGTANDSVTDNNGYSFLDSYTISAVSVGLNLRYIFGTGNFQPYVSAGLLTVPINISYSASATLNYNPYYTASGNFSGAAMGGQASLGLDWHLGESFVISPFAGYQFASGNSFQANVNSSSGGYSSAGQTAQLDVVPTSVGGVIVPVTNGQLDLPVVDGTTITPSGSNVPAGTRPLTIDLGGPYFGIQVSAFF